MAKTFLGKPYPAEPAAPSKLKRSLSFSLVAMALLLTSAGFSYYTATAGNVSDPSIAVIPSANNQRTLGSIADIAPRPLAAVTPTPTPTPSPTLNSTSVSTAVADQRCATAIADPANAPAFPIINAAFSQGGTCPQENWNLAVYEFFIKKLLGVANWLAIAIAILLTVWAGVLYISGFANEANAKKAKDILVATYVGLIIVILARLIVSATLQVAIGEPYKEGTLPTGSTNFIK